MADPVNNLVGRMEARSHTYSFDVRSLAQHLDGPPPCGQLQARFPTRLNIQRGASGLV